jgi:hypothetical protein
MKKLSLILTALLGIFFVINTKAQTPTDYFVGK